MDHQELTRRLNRDERRAAATLSDDEARFLVSQYYMMQEDRKRADNQVLALEKNSLPNATISWLAEQATVLENQIKISLDVYTDNHPIGRWMKSHYGIGPVIAAGILAHLDITKAPTAGAFWRYAGLDPSVKWEKGQKRPWNAELKTLCYKMGDCFKKFSNNPKCFYGHLYKQRKEYEIQRNDAGGNAAEAARLLPRFRPETEAAAHMRAGKLPPAQLDARARRWAVKIFLSHLQAYWWKHHYGTPAKAPFAIAILNHAHMIEAPELEPA